MPFWAARAFRSAFFCCDNLTISCFLASSNCVRAMFMLLSGGRAP